MSRHLEKVYLESVGVVLFTMMMFLSLFFLTAQPTLAQGLEPVLVTATRQFSDCNPGGAYQLEFYNVGSAGGNTYSQAKFIFPDTTFVNKPDGSIACEVTGYSELLGTFSGGPNGLLEFPAKNDEGITTCQVVDGKNVVCNFELNLYDLGISTFTWDFVIENPQAFQSTNVSTPTDAGPACSPTVRGLDPKKPGDIISPGASYSDPTGKEVGIIQERWFFNGKEGSSITWDGNPVSVELQWTCLDHSAFTQTFQIAAYSGEAITITEAPKTEAPPVSQNSGNAEPAKKPAVTPLGIAAILSGIIGVLTATGVGIGYIRKNKPAGKSTYSQTPPPLIGTPPPQPPRITPTQQGEWSSIRDQMKNEVENLKAKWRQNRDAIEKLSKLKKKNMLKFLTKQGFEVQNWIMTSPVEVINKFTVDPAMEKVFEKHDTSQDAKIIVQINERIQSLKNENQALIDEVKYLQKEIDKLNKKLK